MKLKKSLVFLFLLLIFADSGFGQTAITVTENTFKIKGKSEQVFYYGFAEGDQLVFNFETLNDKDIKELEISEYEAGSKFKDYKVKKITDKSITITKTAVYQFRFVNAHLAARVCKFQLQRIPKNNLFEKFNTTVYWRATNDSTYKLVNGKYLASSDTIIVNVTETTAKVHSGGNINGHTSDIHFELPVNTVLWSYYIGVNQAGQKAYEDATEELAKRVGPILANIPGYGPLAALALGGVSYLSKLQGGEDIDFKIVSGENIALLKMKQPYAALKTGRVINDFSRMETLEKGPYVVYLSNDNAITGVTVLVKIIAITVKQTFKTGAIKIYKVGTKQKAYLKND